MNALFCVLEQRNIYFNNLKLKEIDKQICEEKELIEGNKIEDNVKVGSKIEKDLNKDMSNELELKKKSDFKGIIGI